MNKFSLSKIALITAGALAGSVFTLSLQVYADQQATSPLPLKELRTFAEVFGAIKQGYVDPVDDKKLIHGSIRGMIASLDPHSDYFDATEFKEFQESTQGEFGGLGIEVSATEGAVKVIAPIEGTPAQRAGVKSGDLIIKIDDKITSTMSLREAVKQMRGKPGTKIHLTIARKKINKPIEITITRAIIKVVSVRHKLLEPGYGYIRITQFQEHTVNNTAKAIIDLYKENKAPLNGIILDLRDDPGGLLTSAIGVSSAFLPKDKLVVYTDGRIPSSKVKFFANYNYYRASGDKFIDPNDSLPKTIKTIPLVILLNSGSASASEIVAGALQDNKRALIIGTQSFGKGSVQSVIPLGKGEGGIKITTARYFTPSGRSIQVKGITPDKIVQDNQQDPAFNSLRIREVDLEHHLPNPNKPIKDDKLQVVNPSVQDAPSTKNIKKKYNPKDDSSVNPNEPNPKKDYQLGQALDMLKKHQKSTNTKTAS